MKNERPIKSVFMTLPEVAEYLRLSIHTIYKMAQAGRIPALKAGSAWRFHRGEIDQWMKQEALKQQAKSQGKK